MQLEDKKDEALAVKLNRTFAAARMLRGRNPAGYAHSVQELGAVKEQLESGDPARMQRILARVAELSGGTFHWDP
jgi:hypothetical protein